VGRALSRPPGIVDIHVHIQPPHLLHAGARAVLERGRAEDHALIQRFVRDPDALADWLDQQGIARIGIINYPAPDVMGFDHSVNEFVTRHRNAHPDRFLAFGGIHPKLCMGDGEAEIRHALDELRLDAVKVHPPHQLLPANDHVHGNRVLARLYERCQHKRVPVMIHTGTSIFPGARGKYGDPMDADDVAVDFPELRLILAHCGRPLWSETAFHLLRRHPHVYGDISGIPPHKLLEYFPRAAEVADKLLFGTDWPSPGVRSIAANVAAFRSLPLPEAAKDAILWGNAEVLFPPR
jgi:predicted TIM-barrel fold metal-dependent hydrolase